MTEIVDGMSYGDFVRGISFRVYRPLRGSRKYEALAAWLLQLGISLEVLNTRLPAGSAAVRRELKKLLDVPRMSTYAIAAMIDRGVAEMPAGQCFVNVGVWHGFTLLAGMVNNPGKKCIGVDNFSQFGGPRAEFLDRFNRRRSEAHEFHDMDYEEYFAKVHRDPIGFYIYDGEHSYENQLKGMQVAEPFFAPNCRILIDDTNLKAARDALTDFMAHSKHQYEVLLEQRTAKNLHPTLWNGITILQRMG